MQQREKGEPRITKLLFLKKITEQKKLTYKKTLLKKDLICIVQASFISEKNLNTK